MNDPVFDKLTQGAMGALDDYLAFRTYQGSNPDYYKRARIGIPVLSTYGRVRATRANERQLTLMERRVSDDELQGQAGQTLALDSGQSADASARAHRTRK